MKANIFRIILIAAVVMGLIGAQPGRVVQASVGGTASHWASRPPVLDGVAANSEWGSATVLTYTHFQLRYQNDAQFLYLLIDVTGEHPAAPDGIAPMENIMIRIDGDQDGTLSSSADLEYFLKYTSPHNLVQQKAISATSWTIPAASASYVAVGFGASPASVSPHRVYEAAFRLIDLQALPGHSVKAGFWVASTNPSFTETHPADPSQIGSFVTLALASPKVAFIYNTTQGLTDAQAFQAVLANYGGFTTDLITLSQVASIDFSQYQAIIVGHDTGSGNATSWLGTAAALAKIQRSGKPVLGIGNGGVGLFDDMGLALNAAHSATFTDSNSGRVQVSFATQHPAWNVPNAVPIATDIIIYSPAVTMRTEYSDDIPAAAHVTDIGNRYSDSHQMSIVGQQLNGVCYTLWGYYSHPELLNLNGKKLFANVVANPVCMPRVLYIGASGNNTLMNGMFSVFTEAGMGGGTYAIDPGQTIGFSNTAFDEVVIGWDTASVWNIQSNVDAVRNSGLPVVMLGEGGDHLFVKLGLSYNGAYTQASTLQKQAVITNPLLPVMRAPYPIFVDSTLAAPIDSSAAGVDEFLPTARLPLVIGNLITNTAYHSILTQASNGVCYSYWGFEDYEANMSLLAENLLRNMAANTNCNYGQFMPILRK